MTAPEVSSPETAAKVLEYLRSVATRGYVPASQRAVSDRLGIGRQTAGRALKRLVIEGRITVARFGTGDMYPTIYRIKDGAA